MILLADTFVTLTLLAEMLVIKLSTTRRRFEMVTLTKLLFVDVKLLVDIFVAITEVVVILVDNKLVTVPELLRSVFVVRFVMFAKLVDNKPDNAIVPVLMFVALKLLVVKFVILKLPAVRLVTFALVDTRLPMVATLVAAFVMFALVQSKLADVQNPVLTFELVTLFEIKLFMVPEYAVM